MPCGVKSVKSPKDQKPVRNAFGSIPTVGKLQKSQNRGNARTRSFFDSDHL